jgi:peptide/nickel transport system substrate-binding protein
MRRKRVIGGLALAMAGMAALAACSSSSSGASSTPTSSVGASQIKSGGTFTYALDEDLDGFNINNASDNEFVLQEVVNQTMPQVFVTTNALHEQLDTDYVTSATVTNSNPQTVVYQINPKAVWSDGVPINAADFIYNWEAQSGNPKYKDVGGKAFLPAGTAGYNQIKSVTGSNGGKTVTVVFSKPFGDWQSLFGDLLPAHIAEKVGFDTGFQTFNAAVKVSGGPYEISSYTTNEDLVETPNPKWWGAPVKLSKLVFRIFADDNQIPPALQNNEISGANPAQATLQFKDAIASIPNLDTNIAAGLEFQHIDFNEANPYLAKLDVRQAIADGTNRSQIVQRIVNPVDPSITPLDSRIFLPIQPQYQNTSGSYSNYDPAEAKSLLQASGMTMGSDGYFHPKTGPEAGQDLSFTISTTSGQPARAEIEQLFQADMKAIGIKINIQNYAAATLFGTVLPKGEFDITEFAWVDTPFASGNESIYCSYTNTADCGNNWDHFANPQVDSLFNQALTTVNPTTAASLYNQIDALLWKNMVTLPLYDEPQLNTWSSQFANLLPNPSNVGLTWNAQTWGLKAA